MFAISPTRGVAAASFDAARGLLANNPALMLILGGTPALADPVAESVPAADADHRAGDSLAGDVQQLARRFRSARRYALQYTPALIPAIGILLREAPQTFRVFAGGLFVFQFALAAAFVWLRPAWAFEGFPSPFLTALDASSAGRSTA